MQQPKAAGATPEAEVVAWLKRALERGDIGSAPARNILVDRDGSYLGSRFARQLEPMVPLRIGEYRPDVLCLVEEGGLEQILAFEVKADRDLEKGLVQAQRYSVGADQSYLCVPPLPTASSDWLLPLAQQKRHRARHGFPSGRRHSRFATTPPA